MAEPEVGRGCRRIVEVKTVVLGPRPAELDVLIARRQALGLDTFDEVWESSSPNTAGSRGAGQHRVTPSTALVRLGPRAVGAA
jgi:hypothetical protein